jgi:predicted nucleotidyltransferase
MGTMGKKLASRQRVDEIVRSIVENYHPAKIVLFGSLARGEAGEAGDIDLLVVKETSEDPWSRGAKVDRFVPHDVPVDVLVYTPSEIEDRLKMNDFFIRDVLEKGVVLHAQ